MHRIANLNFGVPTAYSCWRNGQNSTADLTCSNVIIGARRINIQFSAPKDAVSVDRYWGSHYCSPAANNLLVECGILSAARRHQQTQSQNYKQIFHGALNDAQPMIKLQIFIVIISFPLPQPSGSRKGRTRG